MAGGFDGSEFSIRSAGAVERTGSATDRQAQGNPRRERRDRNPPNPQRRRLYDLLFEEVERFDALDERQRARLKANLRDHLAKRPATVPPVVETPPDAVPADAPAIDTERIVEAALGSGPVTPEEDAENALLARQLRDCLERHTDEARKVAVYLHLLLEVDGAQRPHTVVDV